MLVYKIKKIITVFVCVLLISACSKDNTQHIYKVDDVEIKEPGAEKPNVKTSTEYISIAYSDVFGSTISTDLLNNLKKNYIAFGDVGVTEDLIIRNFLNNPSAQIPSISDMNNDINQFVIDSYKRVYNRTPNEYEQWFLTNLIQNNSDVTPAVVYYSLMTSNEYRQY
jgi:hypothetical protein